MPRLLLAAGCFLLIAMLFVLLRDGSAPADVMTPLGGSPSTLPSLDDDPIELRQVGVEVGQPASPLATSGASEAREDALAAPTSATIMGTCHPPEVDSVSYVHESGEKGESALGPGGYEFTVLKPGRYWIMARSGGYQTARSVVDVELGRTYRADLTLVPKHVIEVYLTGVEEPDFRWPNHSRVVALSSEAPVGTVLRGFRGGIANPYGIGRFRTIDETESTVDGLHVGTLTVDFSHHFFVTFCVGARVVETAKASFPGPDRVVFDWAKMQERMSLAKITVTLPQRSFGVFSTLFTESGGIVNGRASGKQIYFENLIPGRYLVRLSSTLTGTFVREVEVDGEDVEIGPLPEGAVAKTLVFVDSKTQQRLSFDEESTASRKHFVELVPVQNGQPVTGAMDTGAFKGDGPGEDGTSFCSLSPGIYRARLQSDVWASSFVLFDARDGDSSITIPCSKWKSVTFVADESLDWISSFLTLRSGDGNVLEDRAITGPEPLTIPCVLDWTEARVESAGGSLLARRAFDPATTSGPIVMGGAGPR